MLPGTTNRNGPGWRWVRGGETGTAPSPRWHFSPCPHRELQETELSYQTGTNRPCRAGNLYFTAATLTSAGGQLAAPHRQGGVEAGQLRLPLQVVSHMAVKAGNASREQVQHGHLTEVWPLWQRAAQPEDCVETEKNRSDITWSHLPTSSSSSCPALSCPVPLLSDFLHNPAWKNVSNVSRASHCVISVQLLLHGVFFLQLHISTLLQLSVKCCSLTLTFSERITLSCSTERF